MHREVPRDKQEIPSSELNGDVLMESVSVCGDDDAGTSVADGEFSAGGDTNDKTLRLYTKTVMVTMQVWTTSISLSYTVL